MKLAVMDGPLYAHSNGLVFVSRPTKVHVLLLDQVSSIPYDVRPVRLPACPPDKQACSQDPHAQTAVQQQPRAPVLTLPQCAANMGCRLAQLPTL
jgi:hypothetical protein